MIVRERFRLATMSREFTAGRLDVNRFAEMAATLSGDEPLEAYPRLAAELAGPAADSRVRWEAVFKFAEEGIAPQEILHVSSRLKDDLAVAKQAGMRTALYAGDPTSLRASKDDMKDPDIRPDRLMTNLFQVREILSLK